MRTKIRNMCRHLAYSLLKVRETKLDIIIERSYRKVFKLKTKTFQIMKTFRLLIVSLLSVASVASATAQKRMDTGRGGNPTVYLISVQENDNTCGCSPSMIRDNVIGDYLDTYRGGFQQVRNPQFIFATKNNKFSMALGGYINLRTSYDFMGAVDNIDFVPYYIPMATTYANRQRIMMDATTSRLYMKTIVNSSSLGRIVAFVDMDFRGGDEFSYTPRLRSAYVKVGGFTVGRDVTTFCDLLAGPQTVDFRGPNAYNFNFNTMIRFEQPFLRDHWTFALAAEMPRVNATYGENFSRISQRVPDGVVYLQYAWGKGRRNHLRASGVVRDMYLHNNLSGENTTRVGWGTQFSGHIAFNSFLDIFFNGVYGEGISPYIQDLAGAPYDLMADPANPGSIKTMPMWGWQAAGRLSFVPGVFWVSGGYSNVNIENDDNLMIPDQYKKGQYIFANMFCNISSNCTLAVEYLRGYRENFSELQNTANRISLMVQYNF